MLAPNPQESAWTFADPSADSRIEAAAAVVVERGVCCRIRGRYSRNTRERRQSRADFIAREHFIDRRPVQVATGAAVTACAGQAHLSINASSPDFNDDRHDGRLAVGPKPQWQM